MDFTQTPRPAYPITPLPPDDLDHVVAHAEGCLRSLNGARILITGASGFLGSWMAESLAYAADRLGLNLEAILLIRDPALFGRTHPHLACHRSIQVLAGSMEALPLGSENLTHVIHAAAPVVHRRITANPAAAFDAIATGTRQLLDFASTGGARRFLLLSSGAVYGPQPPDLEAIAEDHPGGPDPLDPASLYGEGKRVAELHCGLRAADTPGMATVVARGFSFLGPRLPAGRSYAAADFLADGFSGGPIRIAGDGTPWRSYLYAADAAVWLWTMLVNGESGRAYNLGSDDPFTIKQLADEIGSLWQPAVPVVRAQRPIPGAPPIRYVPSVARAKRELNLSVRISRSEGLRRTRDFVRS